MFQKFPLRKRNISLNATQKHIIERNGELSRIDTHIISILEATNHSAEMGIYGALSY